MVQLQYIAEHDLSASLWTEDDDVLHMEDKVMVKFTKFKIEGFYDHRQRSKFLAMLMVYMPGGIADQKEINKKEERSDPV